MGNVKRIRDIAEELAYSESFGIIDPSTRTDGNDERKNCDHTYSIVNTVHPQVMLIAYTRYAQHDNNKHTTPPKRIFDMDKLANTAKQYATEERIQQTCKANK